MTTRNLIGTLMLSVLAGLGINGQASEIGDMGQSQEPPSEQSLYERGRELLVEPNAGSQEMARRRFSEAAAKGHGRAAFELGVMLQRGVGGPRDVQRAIELYKAAAMSGDADAMVTLSQFYAQGAEGLKRDPVKSQEWYDRAIEKLESGASGQAYLRHAD